jgi:hypothetical protein
MTNVLSETSPFEIELNGIGVFPKWTKPRVVREFRNNFPHPHGLSINPVTCVYLGVGTLDMGRSAKRS